MKRLAAKHPERVTALVVQNGNTVTNNANTVVNNVTVGSDTQVKLDVSAYQAGVYLINLRADGVSLGTKQFVK